MCLFSRQTDYSGQYVETMGFITAADISNYELGRNFGFGFLARNLGAVVTYNDRSVGMMRLKMKMKKIL